MFLSLTCFLLLINSQLFFQTIDFICFPFMSTMIACGTGYSGGPEVQPFRRWISTVYGRDKSEFFVCQDSLKKICSKTLTLFWLKRVNMAGLIIPLRDVGGLFLIQADLIFGNESEFMFFSGWKLAKRFFHSWNRHAFVLARVRHQGVSLTTKIKMINLHKAVIEEYSNNGEKFWLVM